jgi:hypothetical protein
MASQHRFLKFILPKKAFEAVKAGTKQWLIECKCGHKRDFWDLGGVRHKGYGEPRKFYYCPKCDKARWHKVRKKTSSEKDI